jgi:hypothetical protein
MPNKNLAGVTDAVGYTLAGLLAIAASAGAQTLDDVVITATRVPDPKETFDVASSADPLVLDDSGSVTRVG